MFVGHRPVFTIVLALALVLASSGPPVPKGYEAAVALLPASHWALVTRVDLTGRDHHGDAYWDRRIEIPRHPDHLILIHEVGHVVAYAHPELEAAYCAEFGGGHEEFAEAYRKVIQGRSIGKREAAWMRKHVLVELRQPAPVPAPAAPMPVIPTVAPCPGADKLPAGSIVHGCSTVPSGSVR